VSQRARPLHRPEVAVGRHAESAASRRSSHSGAGAAVQSLRGAEQLASAGGAAAAALALEMRPPAIQRGNQRVFLAARAAGLSRRELHEDGVPLRGRPAAIILLAHRRARGAVQSLSHKSHGYKSNKVK
jgi:hypothetical protein